MNGNDQSIGTGQNNANKAIKMETRMKHSRKIISRFAACWHFTFYAACFIGMAPLSQATETSFDSIQTILDKIKSAAPKKAPRNEPVAEKQQPKPNVNQEQNRKTDSSQECYRVPFHNLPNQRTWIGHLDSRTLTDKISILFLKSLFANNPFDDMVFKNQYQELQISLIKYFFASNYITDSLVQKFAPEYQSTQNAFTKRDLEEQLHPFYEKMIRQVGQHLKVAWIQRGNVGALKGYDMTRKGYYFDRIDKPLLEMNPIIGENNERMPRPFIEIDEDRARELADWVDASVHQKEWTDKGAWPHLNFHVYFEGELVNSSSVKVTKIDIYLTKWLQTRDKNKDARIKLISNEKVKSIAYP